MIELWIVPRLVAIAQRLPHVKLAFETIQNLPDYDRIEADFEIRFGEGNWPGRASRRLFREELAPLASPLMAATADADWRRWPRIATSGPRLGWRDWSNAAGAPPMDVPHLRFDTFVQALRAAESGAGVILASLPLSAGALSSRSLIRLTEATVTMEAGYWITWNRTGPDFAEREALIALLCA